MATVTTRAQQTKVSTAAKKVGGYEKLIRLSAKKRAAFKKGENVEIKKGASGEWQVASATRVRHGQIVGKLYTSKKNVPAR